ncbi:MAG: SWIM zinc finger domain-containing protein, partial [Gammaproteobacteria bacterium]|nr:SWIM zinc finger domain-containing protein [Gammaproteobacteria bacterium]
MPVTFDINYFFRNYFAPSIVSEGRKIFLSEWVSRITFRSGQAVGATVRSNSMQTYRVNILLEQLQHTKTQIVGTCSCSTGFNCKHVAAVLYQLEANMDQAARNVSGFETTRYKVWETWLDETYTPPSENYKLMDPCNDWVLLYVLSFGFDENQARFLFVDLYQTKVLKKGGISLTAVKTAKLIDMKDLDTLNSTDIYLIQQLRHHHILNYEDMGERFRLHPETPAELVSALIKTDRAFWQTVLTPLVWQEAAEPIRLDWHRLDSGALNYSAYTADNTVVSLLPITPLLYYHVSSHRVGPITSLLSPEVLRQCLAMPTYYPDQGAFLEVPFNAWATARNLPPLPIAKTIEEHIIMPTATLTLYSAETWLIFLSLSNAERYQRYDSSYSYAKVTFHYGTASCQADNYEQNLYQLEGDTLFIHPRQW